MFRMPRNLRKSIILVLLFSVIFPWTLMAEAVQQAPKNSLSYFLENEETAKIADAQSQESQKPQIIKTPEKISDEPQVAPEFEVAPPEPAPEERVDRFAAIEAIRSKLASGGAQNQATNENKNQTTPEATQVKIEKPEAVKVPAKTPETITTEKPAPPAPEPEKIAIPTTQSETIKEIADEYVPFAGVLAKMQQNKAKRVAEAQKLGVVLPSQGGDIATVSPSLSKMHQAIKDIMNR